MPYPTLNRHEIRFQSLRKRTNRSNIERDHVAPDAVPNPLGENALRVVEETADRIVRAREADKSRMLTFGAHAIKNGLAPILIELIEDGWITHLATNGAGIIHDWEFAYLGESSEHVAANVAEGQFGVWEETGFYLNLALIVGAFEGLGYGESVGALVENEGLELPDKPDLVELIRDLDSDLNRVAAAADLLDRMHAHKLKAGFLEVPHPHKQFGLQAAAFRLGVPFTGHPMFGHDIIYIHPMSHGAAIGRTAERDFLTFAQGVANLDGGVYISIGSAVMSPMIFEKSLSMAQNLAIQQHSHIDNHFMTIVDLAESSWDWSKGEPPHDNPDYYLRYNKSFSRMGGTMRYASADNRDFLLTLLRELEARA